MNSFYLHSLQKNLSFIFKALVITGFILNINNAYSLEKKFNLKNDKISLHYPSNWQFAYNFLSTPLTLFGPVKDGRRPVISINNSSVKNFSFDKKNLSENQDSYKSGRLKWLKKNNGKFVRFSGYRISKWKNINEVHSIGYSYTIEKDLFLEKSYFFNCNGNLFNINTLMTWEQNKRHGKEIKKILTSLECLNN
ncbi:hypothetical protein [Halobacteriovorax sp. HLS]|uniref:hypothetical protein n=1 Tax=Halobacteriovorax sp. HLS TaxID=2234000 RepID=UPI000FDA7E19|nr:hypothetical protein [Halobacteriovorax sp. HLS]